MDPFTLQQINRFQADCRQAVAAVQSAASLVDVVRASRVNAPSLVRSLRGHLGESSLRSAVSRKLDSLIDEQIRGLSQASLDPEALRVRVGELRGEWECLRGAHAAHWLRANSLLRSVLQEQSVLARSHQSEEREA